MTVGMITYFDIIPKIDPLISLDDIQKRKRQCHIFKIV